MKRAELTGPEGEPVRFDLSRLSAEEFASLKATMQAAMVSEEEGGKD